MSIFWASSIQSVSPHLTSWRSILILSSHLCLGLTRGLFPSGYPTKCPLYASPLPIRATCLIHLFLLYLLTRIIFCEQYMSPSSIICSCFHFPFTSSHLRPKYSPQHPVLKQLQPMFLTQCKRPSFTPIHNRQNYISVYLNPLILFLHLFLFSVMSQYLILISVIVNKC